MKITTKIELGIISAICIAIFSFALDMRDEYGYGEEKLRIELSGVTSSKTFAVDSFDQINIDKPINVFYKVGEPKVIITTDKSLLDVITVNVKDKVLSFADVRKGDLYDENIINVEIFGTDQLKSILGQSTSNIKILDTLRFAKLSIESRSISTIDLLVITDLLFINSKHDSEIIIAGSSNHLYLDANSRSKFIGQTFYCKNLKTNIRGRFKGVLNVEDKVTGIVRRDARIEVNGNPSKVIISTRGNANVIIDGESTFNDR